MTRPVPRTGRPPPIVDAREFDGRRTSRRDAARRRAAKRHRGRSGGGAAAAAGGAAAAAATREATPSPSPAAPGTTPTPAATPRTLFVYAVRTTAEGGETSAWSNLARLVPLPAPPAPTGLTVEPRASGIALSWRDEAPGVAGFAVYRRPAASRTYGEPLATPPATAREYLDTTARYGERYIYTVTALGAAEPRVESALGEESEVGYEDRFAPAPPQDLVALPQQGAVQPGLAGEPGRRRRRLPRLPAGPGRRLAQALRRAHRRPQVCRRRADAGAALPLPRHRRRRGRQRGAADAGGGSAGALRNG